VQTGHYFLSNLLFVSFFYLGLLKVSSFFFLLK